MQDTSHHRAEVDFLTLCVRDREDLPPSVILTAAAAVSDWDDVVVTAARHGIAGYVREAVALYGLTLPAPAEIGLRAAVVSALARTMRLDAESTRVVAAMTSVGVQVIVLKGPVLMRTIYKKASLRPYSDLDLTIQDSDEERAVAALLNCGFREIRFAAEDARRAHASHVHEGVAFHRVFETADKAAVVELHTDPLQLGLKPTCEAARWERSIAAPHLPEARMLCPEDQLVQLSVHVHKHGFSRLIWLKDLDLILRTYGDVLDWGLVQQVAQQEGVKASVWYSLRLAEELLGAPLPDAPLRDLCPSLLLRVLYGVIWPKSRVEDMNGFMRLRAVQLHAAESWRGMLPSLVLMGRRRERARGVVRWVFNR
jgi:hypothetical protein